MPARMERLALALVGNTGVLLRRDALSHGIDDNALRRLVKRGLLVRIRQGAYRIVYSVDDDARVVDVFKIGHRREVYR